MYEIFTETRKRRCLMRISMIYSLILIGGFQLLFASNSRGQSLEEIIVTIKPADKNLEHLLKDIELQTHLTFAYLPSDVRKYNNIGLQPGKQSVKTALDKALSGTELSYRYVENSIIIYPRKDINRSESPELIAGERSNDISMASSSRAFKNEVVQALSITSPLRIFERRLVRNITGRVVDSEGEPLIGVNIQVKGSNKGTATDFDGHFTLEDIDENAILVISYVGYQTQEVGVSGKSTLEIIMTSDSQLLDEVIVVGYGTQSKRYVTGSITSVDLKAVENLPNTNIAQSLRGRVAGLQFTDDGRPGQNGNILIRGPRSISGGNSPLIVLDGVYFNGSLSDINPNDILSIDILKDASATAIYGSRASNGVILITSKMGAEEKPLINIRGFYGVSDWSYRPKILTPERYVDKTLDARKQNNLEADPSKITDYLTTSEKDNYLNNLIVDPWEEISQFSSLENYDVNVSGRTDLTKYFLSTSISDEKGIILNDNLKRFSMRANFENMVTKWFSIGTTAFFAKRDISGNPANPASAYRSSPFGTWYYDDGVPRHDGYVLEDFYGTNTIWTSLMTKNENIHNNLDGNIYSIIKLPILSNFEYRINYNPNYIWSHNFNFIPLDTHLTNDISSARKDHRNDFNWLFDNIITFEKRINEKHNLDLTFLYSRNHLEWESTSVNSSQLGTNFTGWNNLAIGKVITSQSKATVVDETSAMARINYRFDEKYLLTLNTRRDGSSVFSANNKYAIFPSVAFSWIASEENFLKENKHLNYLKLRISYGAVGNQAISPYQSLTMTETKPSYVFGASGNSSIGAIPTRLGNSNLKWETTYTTNFALDYELFNNRLSGVFEIYSSKTKDLLVRRTLPNVIGYLDILDNLGETSNRGFEFSLNTENVIKSKFSWSSNIVLSHNSNKIIHLYRTDVNNDGIEDSDLGNKWIIGEPINVAYDYVVEGVYQIEDDIPSGMKPGFSKLLDINDDGKIDATNDRRVLGQTGEPRYMAGLTNNLRYGNLTLSFFINAMIGWISEFEGYIPYNYGPLRAWNFFDSEWWTEENRSNFSPSLAFSNPYGHSYYKSRDFIRLQDVSLNYDLSNYMKGTFLKRVNVFLSGKNIFTFSDWPGTDPESKGKHDGFPFPKTFSFGCNIAF